MCCVERKSRKFGFCHRTENPKNQQTKRNNENGKIELLSNIYFRWHCNNKAQAKSPTHFLSIYLSPPCCYIVYCLVEVHSKDFVIKMRTIPESTNMQFHHHCAREIHLYIERHSWAEVNIERYHVNKIGSFWLIHNPSRCDTIRYTEVQ